MEKSNVIEGEIKLSCINCGTNLLENPRMAMVQIINGINGDITKVQPCCKGDCDKILLRELSQGEKDGWKELTEFLNPHLYLKHIIAMFNNMYAGVSFSNEQALENYKNLLINCYPYVSRNMNRSEDESAKLDYQINF